MKPHWSLAMYRAGKMTQGTPWLQMYMQIKDLKRTWEKEHSKGAHSIYAQYTRAYHFHHNHTLIPLNYSDCVRYFSPLGYILTIKKLRSHCWMTILPFSLLDQLPSVRPKKWAWSTIKWAWPQIFRARSTRNHFYAYLFKNFCGRPCIPSMF